MGLGRKIIAIGGLLTLLGCVGIYQPDLGDSPFKCDPDIEDPCPSEYDCIEGICRPSHGWKPDDAGADGDAQDGADGDGTNADGAEGDAQTDAEPEDAAADSQADTQDDSQ